MPRNRNRLSGLVDEKLLDQFKYEIAEELGLRDKINSQGWANMTSRECGQIGGKIGGNMVKVLIRNAQRMMAQNNPLP
ncbi:MAG: alpha/beta-type small acid-soluble spore protein [Firmicutes bacterium]|nr:alpha/beta-type small acid-soluble spore protein [Bacillota bacterium]HOB34156.1 alpha/beta-type small acid-soluble spore protein [Bacillota bacterium]HPZ90030.1 alpha/beta-type small acid-soluble spore protein [Bacillota bacterium]HQE00976.1 alpha/beta-type small acid-soluble spore protein [Bacillota bacterium]